MSKYLLKNFLRNAFSPLAKILTIKKARILMYHRFGKGAQFNRLPQQLFDKQCAFLKKNFHVISLSQLAKHLLFQKPFPDNCVVITVDDGYQDFFEFAFPILQKYRLTATVFLTTGFVNGELWLWPDLIRYIIYHTSRKHFSIVLDYEEKILDLHTDENRESAWDLITSYCLNLSLDQRNNFIHQLQKELQVDVPLKPNKGYEPLSWSQIIEIADKGIEFGSHTHTHSILSKLSSEKKQWEIKHSKNVLENHLQREVICFCYPNGHLQDFDDETVKFVSQAGYKCATVAYRGLNSIRSDPFRLRHITLTNDLSEMGPKLDGIEYIVDHFRFFKLIKKGSNQFKIGKYNEYYANY